MGKVICSRHGEQAGELCCEHVDAAVMRNGPAVSYQTVQVDLLDDGAIVLPHFMCKDCCRQLGIAQDETLSGEVWERYGFPRIVPTCAQCFQHYSIAEGAA